MTKLSRVFSNFEIVAFEDAIGVLENENSYEQVLDCYEQILSLLNEQSAPISTKQKWVIEACHKVNQFASHLLSNSHHKRVIRLLKKTEAWLDSCYGQKIAEIKNFTYNTLACAYKHLTDFKAAAFYIEKAVKVCEENRGIPHSAMTYLNSSAVLSELGHSQLALERASQVLDILENSDRITYPNSYDKWMLLGMAHYNIAFQEEASNNLSSSVNHYNAAINFLSRSPQADPSLLETFKNSRKRVATILEPTPKFVRADTLSRKKFKMTPRKDRPQSAKQKLVISKHRKMGSNINLPQTTVANRKIKINYFSMAPGAIASALTWLSPRSEQNSIMNKGSSTIFRKTTPKGCTKPQSPSESRVFNKGDLERLKEELRQELEQDINGEKPKFASLMLPIEKPKEVVIDKGIESEEEIFELRKHGILTWNDEGNKVQVHYPFAPLKIPKDAIEMLNEQKARNDGKPRVNTIKINMGGQKPLVLLTSEKIVKHNKCLSMPFTDRKKVINVSPLKLTAKSTTTSGELPSVFWKELHKCPYTFGREVCIRISESRSVVDVKLLEISKDELIPKLIFGVKQKLDRNISEEEAKKVWSEITSNGTREIASDCTNFFKRIVTPEVPTIMINNKVFVQDVQKDEEIEKIVVEEDIAPLADRISSLEQNDQDIFDSIKPLINQLEKIAELSPRKEIDPIFPESNEELAPLSGGKEYNMANVLPLMIKLPNRNSVNRYTKTDEN